MPQDKPEYREYMERTSFSVAVAVKEKLSQDTTRTDLYPSRVNAESFEEAIKKIDADFNTREVTSITLVHSFTNVTRFFNRAAIDEIVK